MTRVRSNCPVEEALIRKYVDSSSGQRTPFGTYTNEPSVNTAELRAAKKLSLYGTTEPRYCRTSSGYSRIASEMAQKMTPCFLSSAQNVVATDTAANATPTSAPGSHFRSSSGI